MSAYEGPAEFRYEDGLTEVLHLVWNAPTRSAYSGSDGSGAITTRAATFEVPKYLAKAGQLVTIAFGEIEHYGYFDNPMPLQGAVRYTFHPQR